MKNIMLVLNQVWNYLFDFQFCLAPLWKGRVRGVYSNENQISQKIRYLTLIILLLFTISCSLDRTNPLDPLVSGTNAPNEVTNITIVTTENNTIIISWNSVNTVDGYYIYRSQSYDGLYKLILDEENSSVSLYEDTYVVIPGNFYWYKMSAYILVDGEILEGYRSEPKTWN